ncbi:ASCH domain-containing protein [Pseudomaricurvus alkylphenolicus]|uniref:ASCH domain-containing protein n=1 Tax=Pseudomaricurvus alkylphenolicus TaxID=1306991 RepID=UPI00141EAC1E|nr:ASCH domain-containing protein [Pseudomaricurvus alkylphenolicus]NIB44853.1 ASCH domain-containing protein [Pseudomaricurvus alkylphenolicus]
MKALSIRQPWAWLILHAGKDIENRTWHTNYTGPLLIHASKGCTQREYFEAAAFAKLALDDSLRPLTLPPLKELPRGAIVGQVEMVDCSRVTGSPWHMKDQWGFELENPVPMEPIPYKGQLGFFEVIL